MRASMCFMSVIWSCWLDEVVRASQLLATRCPAGRPANLRLPITVAAAASVTVLALLPMATVHPQLA